MEDLNKIIEFVAEDSGDGYGYGDGYGSGYGDGDGSGDGSGYGSGYGDGDGDGSGYGYGDGYGDGSGDGSGNGSGSGYGYGDGNGSGDGSGYDGIKSFHGNVVFLIDEIQTILDKVHGNIAKGRILKNDLTTTKCFILKQNGRFAHGKTLREARNALAEKLFDGMDEEERIEAFMAEHDLDTAYPNTDLYSWHHRLTGSCEMGRKAFAEDHGIDVEHGSMTVEEFIALTKNAYGGAIIQKLEQKYIS